MDKKANTKKIRKKIDDEKFKMIMELKEKSYQHSIFKSN